MSALLAEQGTEALKLLSPAEKYDLLVGNSKSDFTESQWRQGKTYFDETGKVEGWMGICHGWAPAAIMEPRPSHSVDLVSADEKWNIHLNPSEIKGILSYSWATNHFTTVSIGQRCYKQNPNRDENGRLTDPECFDMNPAAWHLAVIHMLGVAHRSFVMDATYDYEVWNQPVISYTYKYFNPQTKKEVQSLEQATVALDQFPGDPYKKYRSTGAKKIVGIIMTVGYTSENSVNDQESDSAANDNYFWANYKYDLELDDSGKLIGGEWHAASHPDFIWTPLKTAQAISVLDMSLKIDDWQRSGPFPSKWVKAAQVGAPRGILLNTISKAIVRESY
jgi:hypothetical protein